MSADRPAIPRGILEAALYVADLDRAREFYGGILGLEQAALVEGRHVFYRCGRVMLLLFVAEETRKPPRNSKMPVPPHGASGPGHLCFRASASEIAEWKTHLERIGIALDADFCWPNGARSIYIRDPDGNSIEFAEPKLWGWDD